MPGVIADRYVLQGALGRGGKANVYLAEDRLLSRQVAIKVFRARAETAEALREQETEARVVASLNHYALTTLFDAGVEASDPARPQIYLVMEHVPGGDLRSLLTAGPLPWLQTCYLGLDLADGLGYLHKAGFLHRDIKPANILVSSSRADDRLRAKLADFGIAAMIGGAQDEEVVTGTAAYLSPEQVDGGGAGPASDVYSLGLVLLETATGRVAFPGGIEQSAFARLDRDPHVPDSLPAGLASVLRDMTARDPAARPSPIEVVARFEGLIVDELVRRRRSRAAAPRDAEAARLTAVRSYGVVGTPPEERFDRVTRLAGRVLGAPIALISIIDSDTVWLKSHQGFDGEEVDRSTSFCSVTDPGTGAAWSIPDARTDPRTAGNPVVIGDPRVRSYAGAPLITTDGHNLGALCVYDLEPRTFDDEALQTLTDLADIVMHELELRAASRRALFGE